MMARTSTLNMNLPPLRGHLGSILCWLGTICGLLIGIYTGSQIWRAQIGFSFDTETGRVTRVTAGSAAAQVGVEVGDTLTHIDDVPLVAAVPLYPSKRVGQTVEYSFSRAEQVYRAPIVLPAPSSQEVMARLAEHLLGATFWLLGVIAFAQAAQAVPNRLFLLLCLAASCAIWLQTLTVWRVQWAHQLIYVAIAALGPLFIHLHLLFPDRAQTRYGTYVLRAAYTIAAFYAGSALLLTPAGLEALARQWWGSGFLPSSLLRALVVTQLLTGFSLLLLSYRTRRGHARRQVRLVVAGTILGCLPLIALFTGEILGVRWVPSFVGIMGLTLIPFAYTVSLSRLDLIRVDHTLYRLLVYVVAALLVVVSYLTLASLAGAIVGTSSATHLILGAVICLGIAVSFSPLLHTIQVRLGEVFYGRGYNHLEVLSSSMSRLAESMDEGTLVEVLTSQIPHAMEVSQAGLWVVKGQALHWVGGTLAPLDLASPLSLDSVPPKLKPGGAVQQLVGKPPLLAVTGPVRWWVPLVLAGEIQGLWVIGPRAGDEGFSPVDRRLIQSAIHEAALVIQVTRLVEQVRQQLDESEAYRQELSLAYGELVGAREAQLRQLALDLHDGSVQILHALSFEVQSLRQSDPKMLNLLEPLHERLRTLIVDLRALCHGLHPVVLKAGLAPAFEELASEAEKQARQLSVDLFVAVSDPATEAQKVALYRIAQEALNNVVKHSGARHAHISLEKTGEGLLLKVEDDGRGFDPTGQAGGKRMGLIGMRERVLALGGTIEVITAPESGTVIQVQLPYEEERV